MNQTFFHRTVTTADIENYISRQSGIDFSSIFNQYLRTVQIPVLEYQIRKNIIHYRWSNTIPQLYLPIKIYLDTSDKAHWINPSENWKTITLPINYEIKTLIIDPNFYVTGREIN